MPLLPPWYSTNGRSKSKRRYRTAEAASTARSNTKRWNEFVKSFQPTTNTSTKGGFKAYKPPVLNYRGRDTAAPSKETNFEPCIRPPQKVYTGTLIKGIATMHKSNAVPVINDEQAKDLAKMRR